MRVTFETDGGFAAMPGLNPPFTIDTASPPASTVDSEIEQLVRAALSEHEHQSDEGPISPQHGGDRQTFVIVVDDDGEQSVLEYLEPVSAPAAAALVERLRALARAAR